MKSGVFIENKKSWLAVLFVGLCILGMIIPYVSNHFIGFSIEDTLLNIAALVSMVVYFFLPDDNKIKPWLFPIGFAILSVFQLLSAVVTVYHTFSLLLVIPRLLVTVLLTLVYFAGDLLCFAGSLCNFKRIQFMKIGALLCVAVLVLMYVLEFISVGGFEYFNRVPDDIIVFIIISFSRYITVILFYVGMFLLSTNKKSC